MKKLLLVVLIVSAVVGGITQDSILWSYRLFIDQPIIHNLESGEYLSKLSLKYYGTPDYWKELALINRAPNPDLVHPDENIVIPDLESIKKLHKAKTITTANKLVQKIEEAMNHPKVEQEVKKSIPVPLKEEQPKIQQLTKQEKNQASSIPYTEEKSSSMVTVLLFVLVGLLLVGGIVFWIIKKKKTELEDSDVESPSGQEFESIEEMEEERPFEKNRKKILEEVLAN